MNLHEVLRERTRLVGTNHGCSPHRFTRMHLAHQVIRLQHAAHAVSKTQRHRHRKTFGHSCYNERHRHHERFEHVAEEEHRIKITTPREGRKACDKDDTRKGVTDFGNLICESVELLIKGCLHTIVNLCSHKHLTILRMVTHGKHTRYTVTFHHRRATHHVVRGEGCFFIKFLLEDSLSAKGFARER